MPVQHLPTNAESDRSGQETPLNHALRKEAENAFFRELPVLLQTARGYWVAYHGKKRLGISYYVEKLDRRFGLPPVGQLLFGSDCSALGLTAMHRRIFRFIS